MLEITVQLQNVCKDYACGQAVHALPDSNPSVVQGEQEPIRGLSSSGTSSQASFIALRGIRKRR
jgi:hypothetical protein